MIELCFRRQSAVR